MKDQTPGGNMEKKAEKEGVKKSNLDNKIERFSKSLVTHKDSGNFTDTNSVSLSTLSTPEQYQSYVMKYVDGLNAGDTVIIPLKEEKVLKIYKVEDGIYSGHIQSSDGTITHNIDRVTVPELVSNLVVKEEEPLIKEEDKKEIIIEKKQEEREGSSIVININLSKSQEHLMSNLDNKIENFYKSKEEGKEELHPTPDMLEEAPSGEDIKKEKDKKKLISQAIDLVKEHHDQENTNNVKDLSKFLVHLHRDEGEQQQMVDPKKVKKSFDDQMIEQLTKSSSNGLKLTKQEYELFFELELRDMIRQFYLNCKSGNDGNIDKSIISKLKQKIMDQVTRRIVWDDKFLAGKRAVSFDEKYLDKVFSKIDFQELDQEWEKINSLRSSSAEIMAYSHEGMKIFGERKTPNTKILEVMEKGNSFGRNIEQQAPIIKSLREFDTEKLSACRIERKTDRLIREAVESNIRKK